MKFKTTKEASGEEEGTLCEVFLCASFQNSAGVVPGLSWAFQPVQVMMMWEEKTFEKDQVLSQSIRPLTTDHNTMLWTDYNVHELNILTFTNLAIAICIFTDHHLARQ